MHFALQLPKQNLTFNVGMVAGGTSVHVDEAGNNATVTGKDNVVAPAAYASGDIRTISNQQTARVEKKMQEIVANHLPKTGAHHHLRRRLSGHGAHGRRAARCSQSSTAPTPVSASKPMPELDPMKRGAGDISFVAEWFPASLASGATGEGAHAPGETIDLSAQPINTKRDALLMYRLSQIDQKADLTKVAAK